MKTPAKEPKDRQPMAAELTTSVSPAAAEWVPLTSIIDTGDNDRKSLEVEELTASIRSHGLLQPLLVRRSGARFELIAGHRRLEAVRQIGWTSVPAVIHSGDRAEIPVLRLVENLQRTDLRATEEAAALEALVRTRGWTTRQVAEAINRSQAYVSKRLRVFEDPLLAPAVLDEQLSVSAAEELLTLPEETRYELLTQAIENHWDRRQVREAASGRFAANRPPAARGLAARLRKIRLELGQLTMDQLGEQDRAELRALLDALTPLARGSGDRSDERRFPPLPTRANATTKRRRSS